MNKCFTIPIYNAVLTLIVSNNIAKERKKLEFLFGPVPETNDYHALCSYSGGNSFALFFTPESSKNIEIIAHEIFHLTHRILDWAGANFDSNHHEQGALLHGYLMKFILKELKF